LENASSQDLVAKVGLVKGEDYAAGNNSGNSNNTTSAINLDRKSLELTAIAGEGNIGGTPDYCSPEQWFATVNNNTVNNHRLNDGRADIFSLGIIFYEMLTRRRPPPYDPNNINKSRSIVKPTSKCNPLVSPQLDQCILKMIDLDPENRQQSIWDLISEIETLRDQSLK
jgi:serine/threonine protein kinase